MMTKGTTLDPGDYKHTGAISPCKAKPIIPLLLNSPQGRLNVEPEDGLAVILREPASPIYLFIKKKKKHSVPKYFFLRIA